MSNDYYNELSVCGNQDQVKQVKSLILDGNEVNFNIVTPMPEILTKQASNFMDIAAYRAQSATNTAALKINPYKKDRISKLPPKAFVKAYSDLVVESVAIKAFISNGYFCSQLDRFNDQALLADILALDGFDDTTPVEQSLMKLMDSADAIKQYQSKNMVKRMIFALELDLAIAAYKDCGYLCARSWAQANWSTPLSALYSYIQKDNDTGIKVTFTTLNYHASQWFENLCKLIEAKNLDTIELSYCYGESGSRFAACKDFDCEAGICYREMDEDELVEFLAIEEDECD